MSNQPARRLPPSWPPAMSNAFNGFPSWISLLPLGQTHPIRLEEELRDGHYTVHAELPGIDPDKDVDITVRDSQLTIRAERSEKKESNGRSEFSYGSFLRTVTLPPGASADDIKATYDRGILTVDVPVAGQADSEVKHVAVLSAN